MNRKARKLDGEPTSLSLSFNAAIQKQFGMEHLKQRPNNALRQEQSSKGVSKPLADNTSQLWIHLSERGLFSGVISLESLKMEEMVISCLESTFGMDRESSYRAFTFPKDDTLHRRCTSNEEIDHKALS
jgi:hypothetical protein